MADIHKVYLCSLLLAYPLQFQNPSLLSCPLLCLLVGSALARYLQVELAPRTSDFQRGPAVTLGPQDPTLLMSPSLSQQNLKVGPLVARLMKILLHFYLVFTIGIAFSYLVKVSVACRVYNVSFVMTSMFFAQI